MVNIEDSYEGKLWDWMKRYKAALDDFIHSGADQYVNTYEYRQVETLEWELSYIVEQAISNTKVEDEPLQEEEE